MRRFILSFALLVGCANLERGSDPVDPPAPPVDVDAGLPDPQPTPDAPTTPPDTCTSGCTNVCEDDLECGPDDKCHNGQCYERCDCDEDCDPGEKCIWGLCKPNK